ncbi:MAG: hypothetical protein LBN36_00195 [Clostridiales Family XIII bacterium]|jgi:hypothetical protein|nr:hypothetical protein [Clostridiales Family XIII bacterium]
MKKFLLSIALILFPIYEVIAMFYINEGVNVSNGFLRILVGPIVTQVISAVLIFAIIVLWRDVCRATSTFLTVILMLMLLIIFMFIIFTGIFYIAISYSGLYLSLALYILLFLSLLNPPQRKRGRR